MDDEYSPQALAVVAYSTSEEDSGPESKYDSDLEIQTIYTFQPIRALALKNANAISKAFLVFHSSKTFASKNGIPHYCKFFCNSATIQF